MQAEAHRNLLEALTFQLQQFTRIDGKMLVLMHK